VDCIDFFFTGGGRGAEGVCNYFFVKRERKTPRESEKYERRWYGRGCDIF